MVVSISLIEKRHLNMKGRIEKGSEASSVTIWGKSAPGKGKSGTKRPR